MAAPAVTIATHMLEVFFSPRTASEAKKCHCFAVPSPGRPEAGAIPLRKPEAGACPVKRQGQRSWRLDAISLSHHA